MEEDQQNTPPAPAQNGHGVTEEEKEQASKEITQTDRINKSLLNSFLQRLDDANSGSNFPKVERINTDDTEPEERDDEKWDDDEESTEQNTDR